MDWRKRRKRQGFNWWWERERVLEQSDCLTISIYCIIILQIYLRQNIISTFSLLVSPYHNMYAYLKSISQVNDSGRHISKCNPKICFSMHTWKRWQEGGMRTVQSKIGERKVTRQNISRKYNSLKVWTHFEEIHCQRISEHPRRKNTCPSEIPFSARR